MWTIAWNDFVRAIVPLFSAQLFLTVLVYFTLVRRQMKREYPFYALFILSFAVYLCGPVSRSLPLEIPMHVWLAGRSMLLFGVGIPALLVALGMQSGLPMPRSAVVIPFAVGGVWSLVFWVLCDQFFAGAGGLNHLGLAFEVGRISVRMFQIVGILMMLVAPCLYLLVRRTEYKRPRPFIYGALYFGLFMAYGITAQNFEAFYAGSSVSALTWAWAVFRDLREMNRKLEQHREYQKTLAAAQYASGSASGGITVAEMYPLQLDAAYPFQEREMLLDLLRANRTEPIGPAVQKLLAELEQFCRGNRALYKARVREVLFVLVDAAVFAGGRPSELIPRLEEKGRRIDASQAPDEITALMTGEALALARVIAESRDEPVDSLVERTQSFINAHYSQECGIDEIAGQLHVSRSSLTKAFKRATGQTVNQYLTGIRIEQAKRLLLSKSVTETAFEVGFNNSNYFSTVFKKKTGVTPKQFQSSPKP